MKTALVVEDDPALCRLMALILSGERWRVACAHNGADGLADAASLKPDVILLDLNMPRKDGRAMLRELRMRGDHTPVVVVTAYGGSASGESLGASALINKPFRPDDLCAAVARAAA
jgi:CheY-like chemotaxis protein